MAPNRWQHSQQNCLENMRDFEGSQEKQSGPTLGGEVNTLFTPHHHIHNISETHTMKFVFLAISVTDQNSEKEFSDKYKTSSSVKEVPSAQMEEQLDH